jgi:hypothetical protein
MLNALKLILDFFLKSEHILKAIAYGIRIFCTIVALCVGIGAGVATYEKIKQGKGLSDLLAEAKAVIREVK